MKRSVKNTGKKPKQKRFKQNKRAAVVEPSAEELESLVEQKAKWAEEEARKAAEEAEASRRSRKEMKKPLEMLPMKLCWRKRQQDRLRKQQGKMKMSEALRQEEHEKALAEIEAVKRAAEEETARIKPRLLPKLESSEATQRAADEAARKRLKNSKDEGWKQNYKAAKQQAEAELQAAKQQAEAGRSSKTTS